jgi:16S rRNA (cytidine1402-2'-O)-methyltransferase
MNGPKLPAEQRPLARGLHVVSTPIGNLGDLTFRALDVLSRCDKILAEDTRVAAKLLGAYGVKKPVERYDDHAGPERQDKILQELEGGATLALISDAGTPLISDPGYRLVGEALKRGLEVIPVPGASALLPALVLSGLPTDRFLYAGFAPAKRAARQTFLAELKGVRATLVLYETGPRLRASLEDMVHVLGERPAAVAREITKLYETAIRGPLSALAADPRLQAPKGEIVVIIGAGEDAEPGVEDVDQALREALIRLGPSAAASEVARAFGLPRRAIYQRALDLSAARPDRGPTEV